MIQIEILKRIAIWLLGKWKYLLTGFVAVILGYGIGHTIGTVSGENTGYAKCEADQAERDLSVTEKRNEIRNNRPDTNAFFNGLLRDNDW